jgi:lambda family phage portal protein
VIGWLKRALGLAPRRRQPAAGRRVRIRAGYDPAQTSAENSRHWSNADALGAKLANSPDIRKKLRERARYERANNSYAAGMTLTLAHDLIGTGPRLQLQGSPDSFTQDNARDRSAMSKLSRDLRQVERAFGEWARVVMLADKLRTMKQAKVIDGEAFALFTTNDALPTSVKLDLRLVEAEQIGEPTTNFSAASVSPLEIDGIRFDAQGNPVAYYLLNEHPGDALLFSSEEGNWINAANVLHWFRTDRPGQVRGVPEITPALPLFAQLRRYTLAVLSASEIAASFAGILQSDAPADGAVEATPFETLEIERGMLTTTPMGWKLAQLKAEQPASTYEMFKAGILAEISRCLNMPYIIGSGDYKGANYSSGRQAHQVYQRSIDVERSGCEAVLLDHIYLAWLNEAVNIPNLLPAGLSVFDLTQRWYWDGFQHVDPEKESSAAKTQLGARLTTLARWYAEQGEDWEEQLEQRAREIERARELGLPPTLEENPGQAWEDDGQQTMPTDDGDEGDGEPTEDESGDEADVASPAPRRNPGTPGNAEESPLPDNVQATALNGAQIAALVAVCDKLVSAEYPEGGAEAILQAAFPAMDRKLIARFVHDLAGHAPPDDPERNGEQEVEESEAA